MTPSTSDRDFAPFRHDGSDIGVLLCHGFPGAPGSMRDWADQLVDAGYTVRLPLLPGHGTKWPDANRTTFDDWLAEVTRAFQELRATCRAVVICGLSMGGTLTLRLAELYPAAVDGVVLVNPSVMTTRWDAKLLLPWLWRVLPAYFYGTDACTVSGVVCADDVAVLTLNPQAGVYLGSRTGYLGYGVNGYSYNSSGQALITQLGYPKALDGGELMQRTNSQGYTASTSSNNTIIGSLQTGGSSGGPWVVNLGMAPSLNGTSFGTAAVHNIVVGVTSWGYTSTTMKQQGASPFTSANIGLLVASACVATPAACS